MARRRRVSKRVCAIRRVRASDGSAFFKCETCGMSVAIALADMHYCDSNKIQFKRLLGIVPKRTRPNIQHLMKSQPISPYRLFMESFMKGQDMENYNIELDRIGFEKWKNMSKEEKQPFVSHARELDNKHQEALKHDAIGIIKIKYGADSPLVETLYKTQMIFRESSADHSKE
ncbi:putative chromatin remodeling & transcriptional activation HMG family [Medicago truncatula]|uniref:High mobility group (HMG)-box protein n=1 Tax=Medicago truncatula TaxID=3880 RepID=A0A072TGE6_MEDTR|nr:uncharacterized protein LOC25480599 [Medicago truncatula]KEH16417.1 high mobility group (HMG)-box protein [Medicago truncatula]RHN55781.1 putative chromatin remodeling & transcriptional activation HMG family [Medicago truncatula]